MDIKDLSESKIQTLSYGLQALSYCGAKMIVFGSDTDVETIVESFEKYFVVPVFDGKNPQLSGIKLVSLPNTTNAEGP